MEEKAGQLPGLLRSGKAKPAAAWKWKGAKCFHPAPFNPEIATRSQPCAALTG
jgi:hypothetical protein